MPDPKKRKPRKFWIAITYSPKINPVQQRECKQTIRAGRRFLPGDLVAFHGWAGVPRHSKWSWRTPYWQVKEAINIIVHEYGIQFEGQPTGSSGWVLGKTLPWESLEWLAEMDSIEPAEGGELGKVLWSMRNKKKGSFEAQIIRWY